LVRCQLCLVRCQLFLVICQLCLVRCQLCLVRLQLCRVVFPGTLMQVEQRGLPLVHFSGANCSFFVRCLLCRVALMQADQGLQLVHFLPQPQLDSSSSHRNPRNSTLKPRNASLRRCSRKTWQMDECKPFSLVHFPAQPEPFVSLQPTSSWKVDGVNPKP
jgi:hypothetical protein